MLKMTRERFPATRLSYEGREHSFFNLFFIFLIFLNQPSYVFNEKRNFLSLFFSPASPIAKTGKS